MRTFTARQVCEVTGVTYRQLDYWDRSGLVRPTIRGADGSGSRRAYSMGDLLAVALIAELLAEGHHLPRSGNLLSALLDSQEEPTGLLFVTPEGHASRDRPSTPMYWCLNLDRLTAKVDGILASPTGPKAR